jgi:hypothetical protein
MSTGDPICSTCGNYKMNCTCGTINKSTRLQEIIYNLEQALEDLKNSKMNNVLGKKLVEKNLEKVIKLIKKYQ